MDGFLKGRKGEEVVDGNVVQEEREHTQVIHLLFVCRSKTKSSVRKTTSSTEGMIHKKTGTFGRLYSGGEGDS